MNRTRIKFCGITRAEDARLAASLGVDAIGLVLVPQSPRYLDPEAARELGRALPPFVSRVALLMDADADFVARVVDRLRPDVLQFHGAEPPAFCRAFARPYVKTVPMVGAQQDLGDWSRRYADAAALLLDGHAAGELGGQGRRFDWSGACGSGQPLILAGGLAADNVGEAIRRLRPYAVDVSSGIEYAPGLKDAARMQQFIEEVRRADTA